MRCAACDEKCYNRTAKYYTVLQNSNLYNHALQQYWKELEALPHCGKQTGDQFCAQARHEVSVWGCLLVEHSDSSTVDTPLLIQTYDRCEQDFGPHATSHQSTVAGGSPAAFWRLALVYRS